MVDLDNLNPEETQSNLLPIRRSRKERTLWSVASAAKFQTIGKIMHP